METHGHTRNPKPTLQERDSKNSPISKPTKNQEILGGFMSTWDCYYYIVGVWNPGCSLSYDSLRIPRVSCILPVLRWSGSFSSAGGSGPEEAKTCDTADSCVFLPLHIHGQNLPSHLSWTSTQCRQNISRYIYLYIDILSMDGIRCIWSNELQRNLPNLEKGEARDACHMNDYLGWWLNWHH